MKKRLNITISEDLIEEMKKIADHRGKGFSNIVEEHFEKLLKPSKFPRKMSLVEYVKTLPKSRAIYPEGFDFKEEYYEAKAKEYDKQNPI